MLKIVTYNIECGLQNLKLLENVKFFANQESVNIFCFQEARKQKNQPFIVEEFLKILGPKWKAEFFLEPEIGGVGLALCIMWNSSCLSLKSCDKLKLPLVEKLYFWESVFAKAIIGYIETSSWLGFLRGGLKPLDLRRGALVCDFIFNSLNLKIITSHLDWAGGEKQRLKQIGAISDYLQGSESDLQIVCGDFNTLGEFFSSKKASRVIQGLLPNGFVDALAIAKPTAKLFHRLDYIFAKGFKDVSAKVFELSGSDHKPVMACLN